MQRYQPSLEWVDNDAFPYVTEDPEGDYILHSDHAEVVGKITEELDELRAALRDALAAHADHADRLAKLERFYAAYIERLNAIAGCSSDPEHGSTRIDAAYTEFRNAAADLKGKP